MSIPAGNPDEQFLAGGGEMGILIRAFDWTKTSLGEVKNWPQSLKTCVRIILTSRQPMFVWWGKELINIYNDAYLSIIGGKHPDALGKPASYVWSEIWDQVGPRAATVMENNEGTYDEALLLIMERNGYPEETYYTFSYSPVPGDNGGTDGIICANTDDTDRIIDARQLRTLKDLGKYIIDCKGNSEVYERTIKVLQQNTQDFPAAVIYEVTEEGRLLQQVKKYLADLPQNFTPETINLEERGEKLKVLKQVIETSKIGVIDNLIETYGDLPKGPWAQSPDKFVVIPIKHSSQKIPFAILGVTLNPYRLADEKYTSFFQLVADQLATGLANVHAYEEERKRAEALAEIDKAKTVFFSNISHEFRTPLTLMLGPLEDLMHAPGNSFSLQQKENIETTHRNAMRLLRLVNSLLDFSRIEAGRGNAHFQPVNLAAFTKELSGSFQSILEKAGLQLEIECLEKLEVYVDKEMWEKIVFNLLSNAFKYTLQGKVTICMKEENDQAVLSVKDTGVGIPTNELPKMFDRFHRVANTVGRSYEGTGIGLSLVNELVKLHHGTITVDSVEGEGSEFIISIPMGKNHLNPNEIIVASEETTHEVLPEVYVQEAVAAIKNRREDATDNTDSTTIYGRNEKVLIVDDNSDMRTYIEHLLDNFFFTATASNGKEALEKVENFRPDIIITDIMMPVMDGIELLQHLKTNPKTAALPVIFLSARAGEEAKIEGLEVGADDYLVKPFSSKELIARIKSHLKITQTRRHLQLQLNNLLIQAPIAVCILNGPDFVVELANERMLELWGKDAAQVMNKPLFDAMPDVKGQGFEALLDNVYQKGERFVANELPLTVTKKGESRDGYVKFVYEPLRNEEGKVTSIMVLADDITLTVNARKLIEESNERQKLAIEAAQMGTFEWDLVEKEFIYSERLAKIFGYKEPKGLTQESFSKLIHPADAEVRKKALEKAFETGTLFYEARFILVDRTIHWVRLNGKVFYENEVPVRMYGTTIDITDHKLVKDTLERKVEEGTSLLNTKKEELQLSEDRYYKMTDEVQDYAILLLDKDGTIMNWNKGAQNIKGYIEKEIVGKHMREFYLEEDRNTLLPEKLINHAATTGRAMQEGYRRKKDGSRFWASVVITALHDKANNVIGFSKVTRDLTEIKLAEDKLKQYTAELEFQNKELEQFAYIASHDLQEPLRKIQIFSQLLHHNISDKEAVDKYYAKIVTSAQRMGELIKSVLNYSKLIKAEVEFEPSDLNLILENVKNDFELVIAEKEAIIKSDPLPVIAGIPLQLSQLFYNIIGNSLKFTTTKPMISIKTRIVQQNKIEGFDGMAYQNKKYTELVFKDNGIGFEQQYADQIFTIFQRLHNNQSFPGTGIGLALCKKIIDNHYGYIRVESTPEKGSSFYIYLPLNN